MKKTLSVILALLTVLSLAVFGISAATGEVQVGYTPATGSVGIKSLSEITDPAGIYHLTEDIMVNETFTTAFSGVLDGCGHTVTVSAPMFEILDGTVKNMVLEGSITSETNTAAVARYSFNGMTAMNIISNVDITSTGYAVGIVYRCDSLDFESSFINVVNNGDINGNWSAGFAYRVYNGKFIDCVNNGDITAVSGRASGILLYGANAEGKNSVSFEHCANNGDIDSPQNYAAGIVAQLGVSKNSAVLHIDNCVNTGNIYGGTRAAGIAAYIYAYASTNENYTEYAVINNCINTGEISFPAATTGASPFVGYSNSDLNAISNCIDAGSLICTEEGYNNYAFITCGSAICNKEQFSGNYIVNADSKFNYLVYTTNVNSVVIPFAEAGNAVISTTVDYLKSDEFIAAASGFYKTEGLPVAAEGDSWNGNDYVIYVAEHVCGNLTYVEAQEMNCGQIGIIAHYVCDCGKLFEDADAKTEIANKNSVIIPITKEHQWSEIDYSWTKKNGAYTQCRATRNCPGCGETQTATDSSLQTFTRVAANCKNEGKAYGRAVFTGNYSWAGTVDSPEYTVAKNPNNHVSGSVYLYKNAEKHIRQYLCCGAETELNHSFSSGKCSRCGYIEGETEFYTITYIIDGEVVATQKVCYQGKITIPSPTKEGYVFKNWNTEENGQGKTLSSTYSVKGDTTYYAQFTDEATVYWFVVYPDGELTWITDSLVKVGNTFEPDVSIAPVGYYIEGWYTKNTLTTAFDFTAPIVKNTEIYAKLAQCTAHTWGEVTYDWSVDGKSCTAIRKCTRCNYAETEAATAVNVTVIEPATCEKAGSAIGTATFAAEWATDLSGNIVLPIDPDNHTAWSEVEYTWTYDKSGVPTDCTATRKCTACGYKDSVSAKYIDYVELEKANCQKPGIEYGVATFNVDWATESKSEVFTYTNPNYHTSGSVYLYKDAEKHIRQYLCCKAEFEQNHSFSSGKCSRCGYVEGETEFYTITYIIDGEVVATQKVCYQGKITIPSPTKEGYVFKNWNTEKNGQGETLYSPYSVKGDTTYYAQFTDEATVTWRIVKTAGSSTTIKQVSVKVGTIVEPDVSIAPVGYYIEGWYTKNTLTTAFDFTAPIVNNTSIYAKLVECTAHTWGEVTYDWSADGKACVAARKCTRCNYAETEDATAVNVTVIEPATCEKTGSAIGTATFAAEWATDLSGNIVLPIDPDNHVSTTVTYDWIIKNGVPTGCTAIRSCSACGTNESQNAILSTFYVKRPTCQEGGKAYTIARFKVDWAEEQKSAEYDLDKDPTRHVNTIFAIKDDNNCLIKHPCCGTEEERAHNINSDTGECYYCGYIKGAAQYTITYIVDGKVYFTQKVSYGSSVSRASAPSKEGYAFVNWYTEENGQGNEFQYTYNTEGDTTYYAYYTDKLYVRFRCIIDGKQRTLLSLNNVPYGSKITEPAFSEYVNGLPEGYYIIGWYTSSNFDTEYNFDDPITTNNKSIYGKLAKLEGWCNIDGEWYYVDESGKVVTGLSRVPYPTAPINGITYAPNQEDAEYAANKGITFIDAEKAWFVFDENGKFLQVSGIVDGNKYAVNGCVAWHVGFVNVDGEYYYFGGDQENGGNKMVSGKIYATRDYNSGKPVGSNCIYIFANDGKLEKNVGIKAIDSALYYFDSDNKLALGAGVVKVGENYIYVRSSGKLAIGEYYVPVNNQGIVSTLYTFDENGYMLAPKSTDVNGIVDGKYYVDGKLCYAGLVEIDGDIYYINSNAEPVTGWYYVTKTNDYDFGTIKLYFGDDGKMQPVKNGFYTENGVLYYYEGNHKLYGTGLTKIGEDYYYVRSSGEIVKGYFIITKTNNIDGFNSGDKCLFDETGKCVENFGANK